MRGQSHSAVCSQYQQEPPPGAADYLTLPPRPGLDMLGLVPCFWLEAEKLPHLLRPFCCQQLVIRLLLNWIFRFPGSWIWPYTTDNPPYSASCRLCLFVSDHQSQNVYNIGVDLSSLDSGLWVLERTRIQKVPLKGSQIRGRSR